MADSSVALADGLLAELPRRNGGRYGWKALVCISFIIGLSLAVLLGPLARSYGSDSHEDNLVVHEPIVNAASQLIQLPMTQRFSQPTGIGARARQIMPPLAAIKSDDVAATAAAAAAAGSTDAQVVASEPTTRRGLLTLAGLLAAAPIAITQLGLLQPEEFKGAEAIMRKRAYGTCVAQAQSALRWGADVETADRIGCFNRAFAEYAGYWRTTDFLKKESAASGEITFYDTMTGKPLFIAPRGRTFEEFVAESNKHGWPSFRDQEVVAENVRVLGDGETVSEDGTHLGHNIPDFNGNRYCINLVSIAGFGDQNK